MSSGIYDREWRRCLVEEPEPIKQVEVVKAEAERKAAEPKPARPETKAAPVDPALVLLMQYLAGARCRICGTLRVGNARQCAHERLGLLERKLGDIDEWEASHMTGKERQDRAVRASASSARTRAILRSGFSGLPVVGEMTFGRFLPMAHRAVNGREMEWKKGTPSGDPMPV